MSGETSPDWRERVTGEIVISPEAIAKRTAELGAEITADYAGKDLVVAAILRGAFIFMADLVRRIDLPIEIDFMSVSSYGKSTKSTGVVRIIKDLVVPLEGKDLLLVEDVVDSGLTWAYLKKTLSARNPSSVRLCSLLDKPSVRRIPADVDYIGFTIPEDFVIGYGLDYEEKCRNLPYVCKPSGPPPR